MYTLILIFAAMVGNQLATVTVSVDNFETEDACIVMGDEIAYFYIDGGFELIEGSCQLSMSETS